MKKSIALALTLEILMALAALHVTDAASAELKQYELFETDIAVSAKTLTPQDIWIDAEITTPDNTVVRLPAFYDAKTAAWKIRFTPVKIGTYLYKIKSNAPFSAIDPATKFFTAISKASDGFLRKNTANPFYPIFESGKPFFGIGHNIGWVENNSIEGYRKYFDLMKKNGCNLTRIWLNAPWTFRIEDNELGIYNGADSEKLDKLLDLAGEYGIRVILVLDTYGSFMEERGMWNEQLWKRNPYNSANGGPCEGPWDFFSNRKAKDHYKNRLRYIIARWSYSPNILAFELLNEMDAPADWTKEMASYIKSVNPHGQFVATSLGYPWGNNFDESQIWGLDEIDIIDRHVYGNMAKDTIGDILSVTRELSKEYNKYIMIGEFGMDSGKNDAEIDPRGEAVALHSSLWAAVMARSFATSLNWWWGEYVKEKDLYPHYKAVANFTDGVKWDSATVEFIKTSPVKCAPGKNVCSFSNVAIPTSEAWGVTAFKEFSIGNNGDVTGGSINAYLHGMLKKKLRIEPLLHLNYPVGGKLVLRIGMVSQGANLIIKCDGREVLNKALTVGPGTGPWKRSLFRKDHGIYQCIYDADISVDIPEGEHLIKLSNTGPDWIGIKEIVLVNYASSDFPNVSVSGLRVGKEMLFWIYNKDYTWKNVKRGLKPAVIKDAEFTVANVENGDYRLEWYDTFTGKVISGQKVTAVKDELAIPLPVFSKDLACKVAKR